MNNCLKIFFEKYINICAAHGFYVLSGIKHRLFLDEDDAMKYIVPSLFQFWRTIYLKS